ncbi:HAD family hydrolase [Dermacoccaceae bacterium W4C1]
MSTPMLIALDLDGTTLRHDGTLSQRVRDAVQAVAAAGHHVVLATGRTVWGTLPVARQLAVAGPAVCSNGAVLVDLDPMLENGFRVHEVITFDPAPVLAKLPATVPDAVVAVEVPSGQKLSGAFPEGELDGPHTVVSWAELAAEPVTRVTFRSPGSTAEEFVALAETLGLHGVNYAVGYTAWLDINPEGVSKASGLEQVRQRLQIPAEATLAVGDQRNDLEMLAWAGRSVAMGQAPAEVQAAAGEVTASVDEDGLALVLEGLLGVRSG